MFDTEIFDPMSGRRLFPRIGDKREMQIENQLEGNEFGSPIDFLLIDSRSGVLTNGKNVTLRGPDAPIPGGFAEAVEAIVGAEIDERGVYRAVGDPDSRPTATAADVRALIAKIDPKSPWADFLRERFPDLFN